MKGRAELNQLSFFSLEMIFFKSEPKIVVANPEGLGTELKKNFITLKVGLNQFVILLTWIRTHPILWIWIRIQSMRIHIPHHRICL